MEAHNNGFSVTRGMEFGTEFVLKFVTQFYIVIDFAVEGEDVAFGVVSRPPHHRLVGVLDVDDRKTGETENDILVMPGEMLIGAAVAHMRKCCSYGICIRCSVSASCEKSEKATHRYFVLP